MWRVLAETIRTRRNLALSSDELAALQRNRLRKLLAHAYETVPFYRDRFDAAGVRVEDISGPESLPLLPVTTRMDWAAAGRDRITSHRFRNHDLTPRASSGSTGVEALVYLSPGEMATQRAVQLRALMMAGFRPRDRLLQLGMSRGTHRPGWTERLGFYRAMKLKPEVSPREQYRRIRAFRPTIVWAYPGEFQALREKVGEPMREWLPEVRAVITSAEVLSEGFKRLIDAELGVELFNFYGCMEGGRIAQECPAHEGLHVNADQLIVEIVEQDGQPVTPGQRGSVLLTSLNTFATPLVRYEIGDFARLLPQTCSCGCAMPLMGPPEGRLMDIMRMPSGRYCSQNAISSWVYFSIDSDHFRVVQHAEDFVEVMVKRLKMSQTEATERLQKRQLEFLRETIPFRLSLVDDIPLIAGKNRMFLSKLEDRQ